VQAGQSGMPMFEIQHTAPRWRAFRSATFRKLGSAAPARAGRDPTRFTSPRNRPAARHRQLVPEAIKWAEQNGIVFLDIDETPAAGPPRRDVSRGAALPAADRGHHRLDQHGR
jgi:hypothetical protein